MIDHSNEYAKPNEREREREKKITFAANCIENFHTKILKTEKLFFFWGGGYFSKLIGNTGKQGKSSRPDVEIHYQGYMLSVKFLRNISWESSETLS